MCGFPSNVSWLRVPLVHPCRVGASTEQEPRGCTRRHGAPLPPSTLCGCDRSSGNTPTRSLAGSVSPHSACALAGEKTASVKEKKYFSNSEEETACLGPRCCGFQDAGLWGADASLRGCVSSASGLSQVWGRSWRGQMQCPELLWGAVRTQSRGDGALWPASPQQHQQRRWGLSSWGAGVPCHEHLRSQPREKMDPVGQIAWPKTDPILGSRGLGDRAWPETDPAPPSILGQGGPGTELGWRHTPSTPGISGRGCPGNDSHPEASGLSPSLAAQQLRGFGQAACVWTSAS